MCKIIYMILMLIVNKSVVAQYNASTLFCEIPNQRTHGICIRIEYCLEYIKLKKDEPHNMEKIAFLRKLQCTNINTANDSLICCPTVGEIYRNPFIQINTQAMRKRWKRPSINVQSTHEQQITNDKLIFHDPEDETESYSIESRFDFVNDDEVKNDQHTGILRTEKCGIQFGNRIIGGEIAELDEFPWLALLIYNSSGKNMYGCGGSLISNRYILTAAHCVSGNSYLKRGGLKSIRLGEYDIQNKIDCIYDNGTPDCADEAIEIGYDSIIIHPQYTIYEIEQYNDIAMIRLNRIVEFTDFIRPICLPFRKNADDAFIEGNRLSIAGWGRTDLFKEEYGHILSPIKLKLRIPYVNHEHCLYAYRIQSLRLRDGQICAGGERGKDSCPGDSGGPLMHFDKLHYRWVLTGIVSLGLELCGTEGVPGVYTRVDKYLDWITSNLKV